MAVILDHCGACALHTPRLNCCAELQNLKVTPSEFDRVFEPVAGEIEIHARGAYIEVSAKQGRGCPNWIGQSCSVYENRPMECRLYPYTVEDVTEHGDTIEAWVHGTAVCPSREALLPSRDTAEALVRRFLQEIAPDKAARVTVAEDPGALRIRARRAVRRMLGRKGPGAPAAPQVKPACRSSA